MKGERISSEMHEKQVQQQLTDAADAETTLAAGMDHLGSH